MTLKIEFVNGDPDAVSDKLGEVQKKFLNPPAGSRGSALGDAGSGRVEDARLQVAQVAVRG